MDKQEDTFNLIKEELNLDNNNNIYANIELESPAFDKNKKFLMKRLNKFSKKQIIKFSEKEKQTIISKHNTFNCKFFINSNLNATKKNHINHDIKISTNDEGNKQINNYILLENLGKGSYGTVKLCYNLLDEKYYVN